MYRPLAVYHQSSIGSLMYCSLVGFKRKGSYSPIPGLSCLFNHQQLFIEKVTEAPDSLFSGLDEKWIQAYIFWASSSQSLLAWGHFLLVLVMILLKDDLHWILTHWASKKICLSQTTGQDYFRALLWRVTFGIMSKRTCHWLMTVQGC